MRRTSIVENPSELHRIRPLWDELASRQGGTMFQSFVWNETEARVFGARELPRVVVCESDAGAAIVPACLNASKGRATLLGETLFDYRDALVSDSSLLATAWEKIAAWGTDFEVTALRGDAARARWESLPTEPFANAPAVLRSSTSAEEFLRTQNRLGRHSRRVRKHGIDMRQHSGSNRALVRTIYERKGGQGTPESNLFSDPLRREFMLGIASHPEAYCEIFTYETASDLVAALVTFRDGSFRRFYTVYYDQRWASLSPGQVLLFEITAQSLAEGLDCDYMTGEYPYKMRLATDRVPMYRVMATAQQLRDAGPKNASPVTIAA